LIDWPSRGASAAARSAQQHPQQSVGWRVSVGVSSCISFVATTIRRVRMGSDRRDSRLSDFFGCSPGTTTPRNRKEVCRPSPSTTTTTTNNYLLFRKPRTDPDTIKSFQLNVNKFGTTSGSVSALLMLVSMIGSDRRKISFILLDLLTTNDDENMRSYILENT